PQLGESVVEGTVARWLVREGDAVKRDQPLVEVTTDKVDAEIPAPEDGVVEKILVAEGETVAVGTALVRLAVGADAAAAAGARAPAPAPPPPKPAERAAEAPAPAAPREAAPTPPPAAAKPAPEPPAAPAAPA